MRDDPRSANAEFRRHVREWDQRLRDEAKTREQVRQATGRLAAFVWERAGRPDRAAAARRGDGDCGEYAAAVSALNDEQRRRLHASIEVAIASVRESLSRRM